MVTWLSIDSLYCTLFTFQWMPMVVNEFFHSTPRGGSMAFENRKEKLGVLKNGCHSGYLSQTNSQLACGSIRVEFGLSCRILSFSLSHRATRQKNLKIMNFSKGGIEFSLQVTQIIRTREQMNGLFPLRDAPVCSYQIRVFELSYHYDLIKYFQRSELNTESRVSETKHTCQSCWRQRSRRSE